MLPKRDRQPHYGPLVECKAAKLTRRAAVIIFVAHMMFVCLLACLFNQVYHSFLLEA